MNATTISKAFVTLRSCGVRGGPTCPEEEAVALFAWSAVLRDVDDTDLEAAIVSRISGARSPWWPTPGEILALCPRKTLLLETHSEFDEDAYRARVARLVGLGASEMDAIQVVAWDELVPVDQGWSRAREEQLRPWRALLEKEGR